MVLLDPCYESPGKKNLTIKKVKKIVVKPVKTKKKKKSYYPRQ
jgi:hypothetical protein